MTRPVVVITGASRGIGAATARLAATRGWAVAVNYSSSADEARALVAEIDQAGGKAVAIRADMSREEDIVGLFEQVDRDLGRPSGLFNNAGITGPIRRLEDIDRPTLDRVLSINVTGCFIAAREAVRRMSTRHGGSGGAIVNMSSRAGQLGGGGEWIHYAASKGAIDAMTIGLAREVGPEGIRVNAVAPGLIDTEIHARAGAPERVERLLSGVPLGRTGDAREVAETVLWLLGEGSTYVSGAIVPISGGR